MAKKIEDLEQAVVRRLVKTEDYYQLIMDIGILNIYNPMKLYQNQSIIKEYDLVNQKIIKIKYVEAKEMEIIFENNLRLIISLLDQDYNGPEGFSLHFNSGEIIVE